MLPGVFVAAPRGATPLGVVEICGPPAKIQFPVSVSGLGGVRHRRGSLRKTHVSRKQRDRAVVTLRRRADDAQKRPTVGESEGLSLRRLSRTSQHAVELRLRSASARMVGPEEASLGCEDP
mmetsp:Transcript_25963/g.103818  ORF Transcript_25963/g.103818 Transcript_25963/m.103818 type:complete len:121 (-) Transcript_25963:615-977(-)